MANRRALSDEAVQELLDEVTLDIEGDVTVMGAEEGSPTDLLFHEVVDGGSPSHAPPSSPEEDDVVIDVDTSTMDFSVTPKKPHVLEEYMRDVDLSPVAGSSTMPDPGPSQYAERHRSAKRKLLPRMSTPLPKKRAESTVSQPVLDAQNSDATHDNLNSLNTGSLIGHFHLFQGHRFFSQKEELYCIFFFKKLLNKRNLHLFLYLFSLLSFSSLKCELVFFYYLFSQI